MWWKNGDEIIDARTNESSGIMGKNSEYPMIVIGISGVAGVGKTTLAKHLQKVFSNVVIMSYGDEVKKIARESFGWNGEKDDKGRKLLQLIGTEVGRDYNNDIWVDVLGAKLFKAVHTDIIPRADRIFIIDDVRFHNEADFVRSFPNGFLIHLISDDITPMDHRSEARNFEIKDKELLFNNTKSKISLGDFLFRASLLVSEKILSVKAGGVSCN